MYLRTHVCMYVCVYVRMYVCMLSTVWNVQTIQNMCYTIYKLKANIKISAIDEIIFIHVIVNVK